MGKKRIKHPKSTKGAHIRAPEHKKSSSSNVDHPAFCFRYIQKDYDLKNQDKDFQSACFKRLLLLGQNRWGNIQKAPRHGLGHEKIDQDSIKVPLPDETPGDRNFLAFRLGSPDCGKKSVMIGYRKEKIFYVVWIDPHGKVYRHG